jgi:integrase
MARRGRGEGSVFFDETRQRWVALVSVSTGSSKRVRRKVTARTKTDVIKRQRALQAQVDAGLPVPSSKLTVGGWLAQWLEDVLPAAPRVRSSNTLDNYRWAVDKHLVPSLGSIRLSALTPDDVERFLRAKAKAGLSKSSLTRLRTVLTRALRDAERRGKVVRNVATLVDVPPAPSAEGRSLTVEQARVLLDAVQGDPLEALVVTGLMVGLRPGELLGLAWAAVDLDAAVLHVRQSLKRERVGLRIGELKTKRSRRTLDLPGPVVEALRRHHANQAADRLAAGPAWNGERDLVFTTAVGTPIDPRNLRRAFSGLTNAAGLGHWHPHELRHSTASLLSAAGVPLEQIADMLGHDGTRMTAQVYRHAVSPSVNAGVAPMESIFGA